MDCLDLIAMTLNPIIGSLVSVVEGIIHLPGIVYSVIL